MTTLRCVSYLSPSLMWLYQALADQMAATLNTTAQVTQSQYDPMDDPALLTGEIDVAFMCGLPLVRRERAAPGKLLPLVAPVMRAERYADQPIYFSDVIVRADSRAQTFEDLAGLTLCYNDPGSNSGYNTLRYRLLKSGHTNGFFGKVIPSGGHLRSIEWVVSGHSDCSAIDSLVLAQAFRADLALADQLRVVESLGPTTNPPVVAAAHLGIEAIQKMIDALLHMENAVLEHAAISRYTPVKLSDYASVADMYDEAERAGFMTIR